MQPTCFEEAVQNLKNPLFFAFIAVLPSFRVAFERLENNIGCICMRVT